MTVPDRAALAIRTAAELLTTAAALIEAEHHLGETAAALRHPRAVSGALEAASAAGQNWGEVADVIDAALAPTLAPGLAAGAATFGAWQALQQELPEGHRPKKTPNSPPVSRPKG